ncbi:hypothetical protein IRZ71_16965 [Flavobacterium sp. ANB]|uniref:hypothetical protein n=1 Tax=unclassified Flavobacterium TaxID=196869 RepID=UPI0012B93D39|nr:MULTISPECIES: hypothetical protein [unclassified Flavobacterium]MBF4518059.1 hypothetical protein [Flavobacterium sp. ANB]MTD71197.1 hypothetical protein [Flavobacterium sp. LC2016-13]
MIKKRVSNRTIKKAIWIYCFLLVFEGALRKWIFPSLSNEILLIRDPLALLILFLGFKNNLFSEKNVMSVMMFLGIFSFIATLIFGHQSLNIAIYGLRPFILHIPVAFVIGSVFDRESVIKLGVWTMYLLIPMTMLLMIQFYSPQSAWVNRGVGGDVEGSGFGGALGFFRSSGTFSFINGLSLFYGLASAYMFYFLLDPKYLKRLILVLCVIATILSIPFTISRTVFFQNILCLCFFLFVLIRRPESLKKVIPVCLFMGLIIFFFADNKYVSTASEAFTHRFLDANQTEGGVSGSLVNRTFGTSLSDIFSSNDLTFFGKGIGMYSNLGIQTFHLKDYKEADFEWLKIITEMGLIFGLIFILLRVKIVITIFFKALKKINQNDYLPWMLLSFGSMIILLGQLSQPTALGFFTLILGLLIASLKKEQTVKEIIDKGETVLDKKYLRKNII